MSDATESGRAAPRLDARAIQVVLGAVWMLEGLLQLQPLALALFPTVVATPATASTGVTADIM